MFIRRTATRNTLVGESYFTYRLVKSARVDGKVRQLTLLNLGRNFPLATENWPILCSRIEEIIGYQKDLLPSTVSPAIEKMAQRYAAQIIVRTPQKPETKEQDQSVDSGNATTTAAASIPITTAVVPTVPAVHEVDVDSLSLIRPRSVGVEHVGLHAMNKLGLMEVMKDCGISGIHLAAVTGNIIARMAAPASERATWKWLLQTSSLGELLGVDFEGLSHMCLYRASDMLIKHKEQIESTLYNNIQSLFSLETTITLYDLTNTYFEGEAGANPKAARGRSKEKRSDCPLVTLALVLDGSGFVKRSQVFAGNISEAGTLEVMLKGLNAPTGAMIIMDRGIATQANLDYLIEHGYRYLVCRRGGARQFDDSQATPVTAQSGDVIKIQKCLSADEKEVHLYCHSLGREQKEVAINEHFITKFEAALQKLSDGLKTKKCEKRLSKINERIGRLKEKSRGVSQHYDITLQADEIGENVISITWKKSPILGSSLTNPGVYCLSSNETSWTEEQLWRTYMTLTDLEAVFRSLKSELGLRPIYHQKEKRVEGHLFITVLAYQCVQMLRTTFKQHNITECWNSLRNIMGVQRRVTASFNQKDGRTLNVRKATVPEPELLNIYNILEINTNPGGIKKLVT